MNENQILGRIHRIYSMRLLSDKTKDAFVLYARFHGRRPHRSHPDSGTESERP